MKITRGELKQAIKEEIQATMGEGMFDFITGGSFDAERFKEAATERLQRYILPTPRKGERPEDAARKGVKYLEHFMDGSQDYAQAMNPDNGGSVENAVSSVKKDPKFMRGVAREVLAHLHPIDNILPRKAYKDFTREREGNNWGLSDFKGSSDADYDDWIHNNLEVAEAMSEIVATIMTEYYYNAHWGEGTKYSSGGKEEDAFNKKLTRYYKKALRWAKAFDRYPHGQGSGEGLDRQTIKRIQTASDPAAEVVKHVSTKDLDYLMKIMRDSGYDKINPQLYKMLNNFNHYSIVSKIQG